MSLRGHILSRRIKDRSFTFSCRSLKDFRNVEIGDNDLNYANDRRVLDGRDGHDDAQLDDAAGTVEETASPWSSMLPELLEDVVRRVEVCGEYWPLRQSVVSCACVCKQWRLIAKEVVKSASNRNDSKITFPSCLKKPGPRDFPIQCLIKRDKKNAKFYLYLSLSPSFTDKGKFLLAARRVSYVTHTEYIISLCADDFSQGSNAYVGKLRSDFSGTNFTIYDSQPPYISAKPSSSRASRRFASKQISPQVPASNFEVGQVSYKSKLLKSRGLRTMICAIKCPWTAETVIDNLKGDDLKKDDHSAALGYSVLRNKIPRWHQRLQLWCLNFHGRVNVASVKNFQLVATLDQSQAGGKGDEEAVLLQFGKVGDDVFTMDFRQPLSAFQAFAICLTSFGSKLGCV